MRCAAALLVVASACGDPIASTHAGVREAISAGSAALPIYTEPPPPPPPCPTPARRLGDGLTAERQSLTTAPALGLPPCFDLVRASPARFHLRLLTKQQDGTSQPAPAWRERFRLAAVTNAGMFHAEGAPVGLLVEDGTELGANNTTFGGYLAFDPRSATDPAITITGRDCDGFDLTQLKQRYRSILQSNRLLGCRGEPLPWIDPKRYSASAVGLDRRGNVVFIHARAATTMTELAKSVAALDLTGALFLEGGPEASLVVRGSDAELSRVGSYETGFVENDENNAFWWLPNVLALEAN